MDSSLVLNFRRFRLTFSWVFSEAFSLAFSELYAFNTRQNIAHSKFNGLVVI